MATRAKLKHDPLEYDLDVALSKARSACLLAIAVTEGYIQVPDTRADLDVTLGWFRDFAFDALQSAHDEIEAAARKSVTPGAA